MSRHQQGIVLVASLIILLIVSILALTLGTNSIDTLRQANSHYTKVLSYNTAESALGAAESALWNHKNDATWLSSASNVITLDTSLNGYWWRSNWSSLSSVQTLTDYTHGRGLYRIEKRQFIPINAKAGQTQGVTLFRITSRGEGPDYDQSAGGGMTLLQSHYALFTTN